MFTPCLSVPFRQGGQPVFPWVCLHQPALIVKPCVKLAPAGPTGAALGSRNEALNLKVGAGREVEAMDNSRLLRWGDGATANAIRHLSS